MKTPWHVKNPGLVETIRTELREHYPNLHLYLENGLVRIRGSFPLAHEGSVLDRYVIEIVFPEDYPASVPKVHEVGGRISHTADYHIDKDGAACLFIPDERWWVWPLGASFLDFLNGPVRHFFLGQSLVERGEKWPFGEWQHGNVGIIEFYRKLLQTEDVSTIARYLLFLSEENAKGHWECPCGSRKRVRACHRQQLYDLRQKIPATTASMTLKRLSSQQKSSNNSS